MKEKHGRSGRELYYVLECADPKCRFWSTSFLPVSEQDFR